MQAHYFNTVVWDDADNEIPLTVYVHSFEDSYGEPMPNPVTWTEYVVDRIENEDGDDVTQLWIEVIEARKFGDETIIDMDYEDYDDFPVREDHRHGL